VTDYALDRILHLGRLVYEEFLDWAAARAPGPGQPNGASTRT
jgi:hypothetical protein